MQRADFARDNTTTQHFEQPALRRPVTAATRATTGRRGPLSRFGVHALSPAAATWTAGSQDGANPDPRVTCLHGAPCESPQSGVELGYHPAADHGPRSLPASLPGDGCLESADRRLARGDAFIGRNRCAVRDPGLSGCQDRSSRSGAALRQWHADARKHFARHAAVARCHRILQPSARIGR